MRAPMQKSPTAGTAGVWGNAGGMAGVWGNTGGGAVVVRRGVGMTELAARVDVGTSTIVGSSFEPEHATSSAIPAAAVAAVSLDSARTRSL
jgi:hypothetical protein